MPSAKFAAALSACLLLAGAKAEGPMPDDIAWKLLEIGRTVEWTETGALYAPLQEKEPYAGVKVERDVKYGPADRNLLDVFTPETAAAQTHPVLIFIHGGALIRGNKREGGGPYYDNIMLWAVKSGFVGVNMTYRLAPKDPWPAGAEDVGAVVAWVAREIAARGGDPARVYLMGHSAGALHVASYVSHPEFHRVDGGGLKGAIMVSGTYDLTVVPSNDVMDAYFGPDRSRYEGQSSLHGLLTTKIPLMIVTAELDPTGFGIQFNLLKTQSCAGPNGCIRAVVLPQHSHMSEVYSINTADTRLTDQILDFVKTGR
jgi:acetyl esterase/lipase